MERRNKSQSPQIGSMFLTLNYVKQLKQQLEDFLG